MPKPPAATAEEQTPTTDVRLSVSEAARLFGVHARTIRRAISATEIRYIVVRGRYRLNFESVLKWSQRQVTVRNKRDSQGIGQWVDQWKITNPKFSPRASSQDDERNKN